ncbi:hypothetical protein [Paenibacillus sp. JJ-223]|uniref:hypothetical protein n=1 Tax=Paenibacillus sp. JJ-223 TaxID=2905647 RepID=UPI001F2847E4|nr:hypothetical protein [Paenibacillus sp. JJ-223]CAH1208790.1 hypothetical protein PAECIP111890_03179 [Paenibacillus sp. JJ-223]
MRHWEGRKVAVYRASGIREPLKGTLVEWDEEAECVRIGPKRIKVSFDNIAMIRPLPEESLPLKKARSDVHKVGYVMKKALQFDNAIYFKSRVMIWHRAKIVAYSTTILRHDEDQVVIADGRKLRKDKHLFVVRSRRGIR